MTGFYLTGTQARSGKSAVAIGLVHQLARTRGRVGVFRPIVRDAVQDELLAVLLQESGRTDAQDAWGVTYGEVRSDPEGWLGRVVDRYHRVAETCDVVLVVGSDYSDVVATTEFAANARIAANLGTPLQLVLPIGDLAVEDAAPAARRAVSAAQEEHARVGALIVNLAPPDRVEEIREAVTEALPDGVGVGVLPDREVLREPTVRDLMIAARGRLTHGDTALLDREVGEVVVAAMSLPHVLDHLVEDAVVIVPGDRDDVVLGVLMAHEARTFPSLGAVFLNGGFEPPDQVESLVAGMGLRLPVVSAEAATMELATTLDAVQARITCASERKIRVAGELVAESGLIELLLEDGTGVVTPLMFEHEVAERARAADRHIVLPEGAEVRVLVAAAEVLTRGLARITLLGPPEEIAEQARLAGVDVSAARMIDPRTSPWRSEFATLYAEARAHKGVTPDQAYDRVLDPSYFGTLMVHTGRADGMVSGSVTTTAATIRPALEVVRTQPGVSVVSSVFLMCLADRVLAYGDCAVNPDPSAEQLADIAVSSARTAARFGIEPRVAMLSYSTGDSGSGADVEKVREATALVRSKEPELLVEGPLQYDAAVDPAVAATKLKDNPVAGRATVLVFPDLNTGNNTYKAVQRTASAVAVGPILQGLNKPINDLSRGATVRDIVNTVAITAIQAADQ